jgi:hypothetical protein
MSWRWGGVGEPEPQERKRDSPSLIRYSQRSFGANAARAPSENSERLSQRVCIHISLVSSGTRDRPRHVVTAPKKLDALDCSHNPLYVRGQDAFAESALYPLLDYSVIRFR